MEELELINRLITIYNDRGITEEEADEALYRMVDEVRKYKKESFKQIASKIIEIELNKI